MCRGQGLAHSVTQEMCLRLLTFLLYSHHRLHVLLGQLTFDLFCP